MLLAVLLCGVLFCALSFGLAAAESAAANEVSSVMLTRNHSDLEITVRLTKEYVAYHNRSDPLYLFELEPYQSVAQLDTLEPAASFRSAEKVTLRLPYLKDGGTTRMFCRYLVAEKKNDSWNILTSARFVDNPEILSENREAYPETASVKGLNNILLFGDAQELGVKHTVLTVQMNRMMRNAYGENSVSFVYNGQNYYLDRDELTRLDLQVKNYSDAGINVYLNVVLTKPDASDDLVDIFYWPGCSDSAATYMLNTRNGDSIRHAEAFLDYLLSRYTRPDHAYGFAPNLILGSAVNACRLYNNSGLPELEDNVNAYHTAYRMAWNIMRSHYANGRVYLPVSGNFTSEYRMEDGMSDFAAKDYLTAFAALVKESGDLPWGLAIVPNASDVRSVSFWNDELASDDPDTPYLTMKNLDVLSDFLAGEAMLYEGGKRSVIISEFELPADTGDPDALTMQSAAYALAYFIAARNEDVDAFCYYRQVDHSGEELKTGLWTTRSSAVSEPDAKKPLYQTFSLVDTDRCGEVASLVRQMVGNSVYERYLGAENDLKGFAVRSQIDIGTTAPEDAEKCKPVILFDAARDGIGTFSPSDGAYSLELVKTDDGKDAVRGLIRDAFGNYKGISCQFGGVKTLKSAHYLTLHMMVTAPEDVTQVSVMLRLQNNGTSKYGETVGVSEWVVTPNVWQDVTFPIRTFVKQAGSDADFLRIWIKSPDEAPGDYGVWVTEAVLGTKTGLRTFVTVLLILVGVVLLLLLIYGVLVLRAYIIRRKRRRESEKLRLKASAPTQKVSFWERVGRVIGAIIRPFRKKKTAASRRNAANVRTNPNGAYQNPNAVRQNTAYPNAVRTNPNQPSGAYRAPNDPNASRQTPPNYRR